jgi:hypothetical protein
VIALAALLTTAAATWLRLALGESSPAVPWMGLAWTALFARHSRRGSFAAPALVLGAIEGVSAPATWTVWPLCYLAGGSLLFLTRRLLPVRGAAGELLLGIVVVAVVRAIAYPFPPLDLPRGIGPFPPAAAGALFTGIVTALLVVLGEAWAPLRMRLGRVA